MEVTIRAPKGLDQADYHRWPMTNRRSMVCLCGLLVALAAGGVIADRASAHAAFVGAEPTAGGRVEAPPRRVLLSFTEPLNGRLSRIEVVAALTGKAVRTSAVSTGRSRLSVQPLGKLADGAYRVRWHTVSTEDGHALEGSYSFGVRAPAAGGEQSIEQSPLARSGWLRVLLRGLLYVAALLFVAALLLPRLVSGGASWLVPAALGDAPATRGLRGREDAIVGDAGWIAVAAAAGATLAEAVDAAGSFSPGALSDFLLVNLAGGARLAVLLLLLGAVLLRARRARLALMLAVLALGAIAASGHASSASPRLPSVLNDWLHLTSGAAWLGGIGLIGLVWTGAVRRADAGQRRDVARLVLVPFGRVALPAFAVVTTTGLISLVIQLGSLSSLWQTAYGRLLMLKIAVVAVIAALSAVHVWRLRPELLATAGSPGSGPRERRHWRLVRVEPALGACVVAIVGVLVAFPLPPRQLNEADEARAALPACDPCPLPRPAPDELPVAARAGSQLVTAWIRRAPGVVSGTVRVSDTRGRPAAGTPRVRGASQAGCGVGCQRFRLPAGNGDVLRVTVLERGRPYTAELPARWQSGGSRRARSLLLGAQAAMRRLRAVRQVEEVTSGPGSFARTVYRLQAPDRMAFRTDRGVETVVAGRRQWFRARQGPYEPGAYGGGLKFSTRSWFRWSVYGRSVRLLEIRRRGRERVAELALFDEGTPAWMRLTVDLRTMRVTEDQTTSKGHFTRSRYRGFDQPVTIKIPGERGRGR